MLLTDLTLAGSEFHSVGSPIENTRVPATVFTREMKSELLWVERSCQEFPAGVSIKFRFAGCEV